jgi:precorrin-6A/cobalt-precorrin-6A reductase
MTPQRILILGGTAEARDNAALLVALGHDVTTSLAGVTSAPLLPVGKMRVGGFGGVQGLARYLHSAHIDVLVDATHPFAANMSRHACDAARFAGCKLLRFERPAWQPRPHDQWTEVSSLADAAAVLPSLAVVLLTTGRKDLGAFFRRSDITGVVRTVEPMTETLPPGWSVIVDRPPQQLAREVATMQEFRITHLVTKNAGGERTRAKLDAARQLGLPVIMVRRPPKPECEIFSDVEQLAKRLGT